MAAPTIQDLTVKIAGGTGTFDELMCAVDVHISEQFRAGRIKGPEYAQVYLGALQTVMTQGLQFLLQKDSVDLTLAQIELTKAQALIADKDIELKTKQIEVADQDILVKQQEVQNSIKQGQLIDSQIIKVNAEVALLQQKRESERAQTQNVADPDSVIGKQINLYQAQTDGYRRDAEQKAFKAMVESWNIRKTTEPDVTSANTQNKLTDDNIGKVAEKLGQGVGVNF